jgi:hypothetical protein
MYRGTVFGGGHSVFSRRDLSHLPNQSIPFPYQQILANFCAWQTVSSRFSRIFFISKRKPRVQQTYEIIAVYDDLEYPHNVLTIVVVSRTVQVHESLKLFIELIDWFHFGILICPMEFLHKLIRFLKSYFCKNVINYCCLLVINKNSINC